MRCALACSLLRWPLPARGQPIQLEAQQLEAGKDKLRARGEVKVRLGECQLEASELSVEPGPLIIAEDARLKGGALELSTPHLVWRAGALEAQRARFWLCRCSGRALLQLGANRVQVARDGARVHLRWPALFVRSRRVLAVPYLALPLRRGVSGLLLPQIGWSGRDGVRLEQAGYLAGDRADVLLGAGWIQSRGAWGHLRGAALKDGLAEAELALAGLQDGDRWRGALQGSAWLARRGQGLGLSADMVSDAAWPAELEREADRVFTPYLRSRGWATAAGGPFVLSAAADVYQDLGAPLREPRSMRFGWTNVNAGLLPSPLVGPLFFEAQLQFQSWPSSSEAIDPAALRASLDFNPRLLLASTLGIFRLSGQLGYRFVAGWSDRQETSAMLNQQNLLASLELSLPLVRDFGSARPLQHRLEPFAGALYGRSERALELDGLSRQQGAFAATGLRSSLIARAGRPGFPGAPASRVARGELRLEVPLDEPSSDLRGAPLLAAELELQLRRLGSARGLWRVRPGTAETVEGRGEACIAGPLRICGGYLRLRQLRAEDLLGGEALGWPLLDTQTRLTLRTLLDQVFVSAELRAGPVTTWSRVALDPLAPRLTQGSYGLRLDLHCRCLRLELLGLSRSGQRWPDWMVQASLSPSALGGGTRPCD